MTATGGGVERIHGRRCSWAATGGAGRLLPTNRTSTSLAAAVGLVADRLLGEPPAAIHPVATFGRGMTSLERLIRSNAGDGVGSGPVEPAGDSWRDGRPAGAAYAAAGAGLGLSAGSALGSSLPTGAVATWLVVAGRALGEEALAIGARLGDDDLDGARRRLPALVGRDPQLLDAKGVARAVVESVAENTVDAVVAPACWAAAGGAAGAGFYRALNTLDAMVGHRNARYARFGWAAARLDDAANWVPARVAGLLVAAVRPGRAGNVLDAVVHPPAHPSPNAGVIEAAFAAALGLRLGGDTVYAGRVDPRPTFGSGRPPEVADIDAAVRLSRDVTLALAAVLAAPAVLRRIRHRPRQPAFVSRNTADKERRFGPAHRSRQPAFVYRNTAEKERRFGIAGHRGTTGVLPPDSRRTTNASSGMGGAG